MGDRLFTDEQRRAFLARMNLPLRVFVGLMLLLATNILAGAVQPFAGIWIVETLVLLTMIVITLLFSMEILREAPLIRMWSIVGFCWVGILFGMTMIDYLTRGRWPL